MRPGDAIAAETLSQQLDHFSQNFHGLPGIIDPTIKTVLIEQMLESIRRVRYVSVIRRRHISPLRISTDSDLFDPLKGAIHFQSLGNVEEAFWMVFLFVHFGGINTQVGVWPVIFTEDWVERDGGTGP